MLLLEYRGLSRIGRVLQHYVNQAPSSRSYDRFQDELLVTGGHEIFRITASGRCIVVMDNYTHRYSSSSLTMDRETQYHLPTCTVGAVVAWPEDLDIKFDFVQPEDGVYLASVPANINDLKFSLKKVNFHTYALFCSI